MTTSIYHICDKCGDEIKEDVFIDVGHDDLHYHLHCVEIEVAA